MVMSVVFVGFHFDGLEYAMSCYELFVWFWVVKDFEVHSADSRMPEGLDRTWGICCLFTLWLFNSLTWYRWPIEIDGSPIDSMMIFHGYVSHNQMVMFFQLPMSLYSKYIVAMGWSYPSLALPILG